MEKALDEALEESPELLQQVDGINDSDVERPGRVEVVTGEKAEGETDGRGGWILVGQKTDDPHQIQRKARKEVETRWPNQVEFLGSNGVDIILRNLEGMKEAGHREMYKEHLDEVEKDRVRVARERRKGLR